MRIPCKGPHITIVTLLLCLLVFSVMLKAVENSHIEDFATTQYKDTLNTTAWWDTVAGEIKLFPFALASAGGYDTPGNALDVAISGDYAYVADYYYGLQVIDISDPTSPSGAGNYDTPGAAYGVAISGDYACVAEWDYGLRVIDISDPANPSLLGICDTPGDAFSVAISGDYAYVAESDSGFRVIDISDPTNPSLVGNYSTLDYVRGIAISGDYAYVAEWSSGLEVIDISDPTAPSAAGSCDTPGGAIGVAISGDYAYVGDSGSGLQVIDISDPTSPSLVGSCGTSDLARGIAISGDYAYVADYTSGIQVIDISDPTNPSLAGSCDTPGNAWNLALSGDYAYIADDPFGLQVIHIGNPIAPLSAGSCNTPGSARGIAISGDYAYVGDYNSYSFQVIDISDPTSLSIAGSCSTPALALGVAISGDYAYVADYSSGLEVIDISDPSSPSLAGNYDTPGGAYEVAISGDCAYVADYDYGLQVIDISDPTTPSLLGSYDTPGAAYDVAISGDYAYVTDYGGGFRVIDISDPSSPSLAGNCNTAGFARGVVISGDYAYVADHTYGFSVIDISDPTTPSLAANIDTPGYATNVDIAGDYAYVADQDYGLHVIDISNPVSPTLVWSYDTPSIAIGVAISGDYAYVGDHLSGLQVIEVFQRSYNLDDNDVRSLVINSPEDTIVTARLDATQTDSIRWELSADGGSNWQEVYPSGIWLDLTYHGNALMWRSTHYYAGGHINPACTNVDIEWLYRFAIIDSIVDIPNDQGSQVRMYFTRSGYDASSEMDFPIMTYNIWRRIDDPAMQGYPVSDKNADNKGIIASVSDTEETVGMTHESFGGLPVFKVGERYFLESDMTLLQAGFPSGTWEVIGSFSAAQMDQYIYPAATLADSSETIPYFVFCITAHTTTPSVWYASPPDSGFSVDNLAPAAPQGFAGIQSLSPEGLRLSWLPNPETDLSHYSIHRGDDEYFVPGAVNQLGTTTDTVFLDTEWIPTDYYFYKMSAVDIHGNVGPDTLLRPEDIYVGTLLQSFTAAYRGDWIEVSWTLSEAGEGMRFYIFKAEGVLGAFEELLHPEIEREGLTITFVDRDTEPGETYRYRVEVSDEEGRRLLFETEAISTPALPHTLYQNHPNPFNPSTTIRYYLPEVSIVTLDVFDVSGKWVARLEEGRRAKGIHTVEWSGCDSDGSAAASGVYFYRLKAGKTMLTRKMILLR